MTWQDTAKLNWLQWENSTLPYSPLVTHIYKTSTYHIRLKTLSFVFPFLFYISVWLYSKIRSHVSFTVVAFACRVVEVFFLFHLTTNIWPKSRIQEMLYLLMCLGSSTDTKKPVLKSWRKNHSPYTCHLSPTLSVTATEPPPANSSTTSWGELSHVKQGPKRHKPWPIQKFKEFKTIENIAVSQSGIFRNFQKISEIFRNFQKVFRKF